MTGQRLDECVQSGSPAKFACRRARWQSLCVWAGALGGLLMTGACRHSAEAWNSTGPENQRYRFALYSVRYEEPPKDELWVVLQTRNSIPAWLQPRLLSAPANSEARIPGLSFAKGLWDFAVVLRNVSNIRPDDPVVVELRAGKTVGQTITLTITPPPDVTVSDGTSTMKAKVRPSLHSGPGDANQRPTTMPARTE